MAQNIGSSVKAIDSKIFESFIKLTNKDDNVRLSGCVNLLQTLSRNQENENKEKEISYALKRLVRGVGASNTASRAGFYVALCGFFDAVSTKTINILEVLDLAKSQLHVGGSIADKEDSGAVVGQILLCTAIIHSTISENLNTDEIKGITDVLISASKYKSYHNALAFGIINEFLEKITVDQFKTIVWPIVQPEIVKPWKRQNMNTANCWLVLKERFPEIISEKYLKVNMGGASLLNHSNFATFYHIFWENTAANILKHPVYAKLGKFLARHNNLKEFWLNHVDTGLLNLQKVKELITIKVLTEIILNCDVDTVKISELLTPNIIKMMITSIKGAKRMKNEMFKEFYEDFFKALNEKSSNFDDDEKVNVIHKLILHPGTISIEKYTPHRIVHQIVGRLGSSGIQKLFATYKNIFLNKIPKDKDDSDVKWLNVERQTAIYMLQTLICHKNAQTDSKWRGQQLLFLMISCLFYFNKDGEVVTKSEDCGIILENIFSNEMRSIFYGSLQSKFSKLEDERNILYNLITFVNGILQKKNFQRYLRNPINEEILKAWNEMYNEVRKKNKSKSDGKIKLVFDILLLHMGLELFHEPQMAQTAIYDLNKCFEKANHAKSKISKTSDEEPEWIEVVIDLFLHLLSQNASSLRTTVNTVFPHLCDSLTLTAVHQILSVLDMKDGTNPLTDEPENEEDEDSENDDNNDRNANENDDDENNDSSSEDDEDDDIFEEEEDSNVNEKLRNAVANALETIHSDPDKDSINLSDMDEEEGKKLDEALSNAFRAIKANSKNKKSKEYRVKTTTVMHFRIRVLDLLEIYVQHKPNLLILIEIMLALYNMIDFCHAKEHEPLLNKIQKTLSKLLDTKHLSIDTDDDDKSNLTVDDICHYFRLIMDKKPVSAIFEVHNKLKTKCCLFLIVSIEQLHPKTNEINGKTKICSLLEEYIREFISSRDPLLNITLINDIFQTRWSGVWNLAKYLVENGLDDKTRVYRRIQIFELLTKLYKNYEHIRNSVKLAKHCFKSVEKVIENYIHEFSQKDKMSHKEFESILNLLFDMNKCHNKTAMKSFINEEMIKTYIQDIRKKIKIESVQSYIRLCNVYGMKIIRNADVRRSCEQHLQENGISSEKSQSDDEVNASSDIINGNSNVHLTNGGSNTDDKIKSSKKRRADESGKSKKLKKQKKFLPMDDIRFSKAQIDANMQM